MKLLIVGSVAYDTVKTPFGRRERILGGSATYCSVAASYFTDVAVLAVVGEDFREEDRAVFEEHGIDTRGLRMHPGGKTFHWQGEYGYDLNEAHTLKTDLNVLGAFEPELPESLRDIPYLFLANVDPRSQLRVIEQCRKPKIIAADTMNFWIDNRRKDLMEVLSRIQLLLINEGEARQLSQEFNLVRAARKILSWGPKMLIIKRGEYGVLKVTPNDIFATPAYPLESVFDPTGAGDSFAGGFMGHLAVSDSLSADHIRHAIVMGNVLASFNVEDFSLGRLGSLKKEDIENRYQAFRRLTQFGEA